MTMHRRTVLALSLGVLLLLVPLAYAQQQWKLGVGITRNPGGGLYVNQVFDGSPAQYIGLLPGDVILTIDGRLVNDPLATRDYIFRPGRTRITMIYQHRSIFYEATADFQIIAYGKGPKKTYKLELKGKVNRKQVSDPRKRS